MGNEGSPEYKSKVRVFLLNQSRLRRLSSQGPTVVFFSIDDTTALKVVAERTWKHVNEDIWSILFFSTSGSANNVKKFEVGWKTERETDRLLGRL